MKKIIKKMLLLIFISVMAIFLKMTDVEASSVSLSANTQSPQQGQTVTVTANVTSGAWNLKLEGAGKSETIYGYTSSNSNASDSKSISFIAGQVGTTYTINLTGDMTDINSNNAENVSKSINITVAKASTNNSEENQNTNTNTKTNTGSTTKSSVATLSNLGIRPNDFSGFSASKTSYSTEVPNDVESIEIYANKGQSGQTISGTGKKTLKEGTNTFSIVVTAEDGKTQKTYTLNVTRKAKDDSSSENTTDETTDENEITSEETEDPATQIFGLTELTITGIELQPQFKTDVYEYTIDLKENLDKLEIEALATEENASIEITGNENLQEGENIITILVEEDTEEKSVAYQIIVNKSIENQEEETNTNKIKNIIIISTVAALILIVIIIIVVSKVKNKKNEAFIPYGEFFEDDDVDKNNSFNNYDNSDADIEENNDFEKYKEEKSRKKRSKGKRFK